ncbi:MAG: hypothetical protein KGY76_08930 [Candidatus Thermoplasmatota archaeon]|nr:hypothetical protein [Candidatus Thermoplasmatota archaeon]
MKMRREKLLSILAVSVLLSSGLAALSSEPASGVEGELIHTINLEVHLDMEIALGEVAEGDLDLFMHDVGASTYAGLPDDWKSQLSTWDVEDSYNNMLINPAHEGNGTQAIQAAVVNGWINDPEEVQYLVNDMDGNWTVNPFAHKDIRFAQNYIMSRQDINQDLRDGYARPRYGFMSAQSAVWEEYFVEGIEEKYDLTPEGDFEKGYDMIQNAMSEIKNNVAFGEVRKDGNWQYKAPGGEWKDITLKIFARTEDWRSDLGFYMQVNLEQNNFDVEVMERTSDTAIPLCFYGNPEPYDNVSYHIYTGGWISSSAQYYQETQLSQMYAPWYGYMQIHGSDKHWQYDQEGYDEQVQKLDEMGKRLYSGRFQNETQYWELMVNATQLGLEQSVRVFLLTDLSFYAYDKDTLETVVIESVNGYDTYFGPRTMRIDDGVLDSSLLTESGAPYMDNWNLYGGSTDIYGEYQRRMAREYGSRLHPQTGMPFEVNNYWSQGRKTDPYDRNGSVEIGFHWERDKVVKNITVPTGAVDYNASAREWQSVQELYGGSVKSAVKVTYDVHTNHKYHDGTDFEVQDIMAKYARENQLQDDTHEPFLQSWADFAGPFYDDVVATSWDNQNGTYTVWSDYTFPIESKIGSYHSIFPEVHPLVYEGFNHMHGGAETEFGVNTSYSYESVQGAEWIHQLSASHSQDVITIWDQMRNQNWIPYYLRKNRTSPIPMGVSELETEVDNLTKFVNAYDHTFIGLGPFYIDTHEKGTMTLQRWDGYGYPFDTLGDGNYTQPYGYWSEQFDIKSIEFDNIDSPIYVSDDFSAEGTGHLQLTFPEIDQQVLEEEDLDDYRFTLRNKDRVIEKEVSRENIDLTPQANSSTFAATIPTEGVTAGHKALTLEVKAPCTTGWKSIETTVVFLPPPQPPLVVNKFEVPETVPQGEVGTINVSVSNSGDENNTASVYLDDTLLHEEVVPVNETRTFSVNHTFETIGTFEIELRDQWDTLLAREETTVEGADIQVTSFEIDERFSEVNTERLEVEPQTGRAPLDVTISGEAHNPGVYMNVSVQNDGNIAGNVTLEVMRDGSLVSKEVLEVNASGGETVEGQDLYDFTQAGDYTVSLGEEQTQFTVEESDLEVNIAFEINGQEENVLTVPVAESANTSFEKTFEEVGDYIVLFGAMSKNISVSELKVSNLTVPDELVIGDTDTIQSEVENPTDEDVNASIAVEGDVIYTETIPAGETSNFSTNHTFDTAGEVTVELRDEGLNVTMMEETVKVLDKYTLNTQVEGNGTAEVEPAQDEYVEGTEVNLTAIPDEGQRFIEWTGDYQGTDKNVTITMNSDKNVTAHFEVIPTEYFNLTVNIEGNGTVTVDGQEVGNGWEQKYEKGTNITINATADQDYTFDGWTGTSKNGQEIEVTIDDDMNITAIFSEGEESGDEDGDDGSPGFTFVLLILGAVIALAIYYNKTVSLKQ